MAATVSEIVHPPIVESPEGDWLAAITPRKEDAIRLIQEHTGGLGDGWSHDLVKIKLSVGPPPPDYEEFDPWYRSDPDGDIDAWELTLE